ncbi:hypothetical protein [Roseinatronobacter sp.]|uniref:hypothetical protein n=1 Tax=Roseinatronobacter sp. TaxID=1945755 RepID=UPI0025E6B945|nr:hypothetical protein [Roseibaca sp.]
MTKTMTPIPHVLTGSLFALALFLALPLGAQESSQQTQEAVTAEDIQAEFDEAFEMIGAYSEEQRDEAVSAMRDTLSEIDAEIAQLEQQARENWADMSEATQEQTQETLESLRDRRNELSEAFGAMQEGSVSAWDELQNGVANAWSEVKGAWNAAFDASDNGDDS